MDRSSPMGSVDKALVALESLGEAGAKGAPLAQLSAALGINKASLHRTLAALRHRGFVDQEEVTGHYRLGSKMLALADDYFRESSLRSIFHEPLRALSAEVEELCHLGSLEGQEIVYLDKVEPQRAIRVWSEIGRRTSAPTTALGRAIISQSVRTRKEYVARFGRAISPRTPFTKTSAQELWEEIKASRKRGFAREDQENEPGICCVGVAISRGEVPIAAISVTALHDRMSLPRITAVVEAIHRIIEPQLPRGLNLQQPIR